MSKPCCIGAETTGHHDPDCPKMCVWDDDDFDTDEYDPDEYEDDDFEDDPYECWCDGFCVPGLCDVNPYSYFDRPDPTYVPANQTAFSFEGDK